CDVFDLGPTYERNVDLALILAAAISEDLDPHIVGKDQVVVAAVINLYVPEDCFSIGIRFDHWCFERQVGRIDWQPVIANSTGCSGVNCREDQEQQESQKRSERFHGSVLPIRFVSP